MVLSFTCHLLTQRGRGLIGRPSEVGIPGGVDGLWVPRPGLIHLFHVCWTGSRQVRLLGRWWGRRRCWSHHSWRHLSHWLQVWHSGSTRSVHHLSKEKNPNEGRMQIWMIDTSYFGSNLKLDRKMEALKICAISCMIRFWLGIMQPKIMCPPCKYFQTEIVFIMMKQVGHSFR